VTDWLEQQGLSEQQRFGQDIQVDVGWEHAVETVLGDRLQAVCITDLADITEVLASFDQGSISFMTQHTGQQALSGQPADSLLQHVTTQLPAAKQILSTVYAVQSLADALALLPNVQRHESIVTREGIWLGPGWLRISKEEDAKAGVITRERELNRLIETIQSTEQQLQALETRVEQGEQQLQTLEAQRDSQQQRVNECAQQLADGQAQQRVKQNQLEAAITRQTQLQTEIEEQKTQSVAVTEELNTARHTWQAALADMEQDQTKRERLQTEQNALTQRWQETRERARQDQDTAHELDIQLQSKQTQLTALQQNFIRTQEQIEKLTARTEGLRLAREEADNPNQTIQEQLEAKLASRLSIEKELQAARSATEAIETTLEQLENKRKQAEQASQAIRDQLEELRLSSQTARVRCTTIEEQVAETDYDIQPLLNEMPAEATLTAWTEAVEAMARRIQRLGAINLAAIDEFKTESERKHYLDDQHADLVEALETLEEAIRKMDKETRDRFKATYDQVNEAFQAAFPRLFGGGQAYLELTGEDLLDTGVTVMARPPGKRNSSIHLLSGGEKAMTAVALVFAIFQLNPSPFCMLDEVDAPLDDANVARFCKLVHEMSTKTQFVVITHNKVTMEMVDQLCGVTMQEPGVSRLVSVDVDAAVELAEA